MTNYCNDLFLLQDTNNVYIEIVVNKIAENEISLLKEYVSNHDRIGVYFPNENLGYMNGMIVGYERFVQETHIAPDYIIMSNTDIIYNDVMFFSKFINKNYSDDVWVIGPAIYAKHRKSYDNPVAYERRSKKSVKKIVLFTRIPFIRVLYVFLSDYKARFRKSGIKESSYVYEVHGCFFVIKNDLAVQLSSHKYGMLLYSEESYIAEEVYKSNKKVYYDSDLLITHNEHSVTKKVKYKKIAKYISSSMKYILENYYE
ncbi:MAG: hypothetical protein IJR67_01785 [Acholeplasmatales bacterium]|nr:hypothetical protein [Acholeplasmatales bacterium]